MHSFLSSRSSRWHITHTHTHANSDFNDHFETPKRAYRDIKPVLRVVAHTCNVEAGKLRVYDPYFCRGNMLKHMHDLGFECVINAKRDFYQDIEDCKVVACDTAQIVMHAVWVTVCLCMRLGCVNA